jgi:hypothetical protein
MRPPRLLPSHPDPRVKKGPPGSVLSMASVSRSYKEFVCCGVFWWCCSYLIFQRGLKLLVRAVSDSTCYPLATLASSSELVVQLGSLVSPHATHLPHRREVSFFMQAV